MMKVGRCSQLSGLTIDLERLQLELRLAHVTGEEIELAQNRPFIDCDNDGIGLDVDDHDSALGLAHVAGEEIELAQNVAFIGCDD